MSCVKIISFSISMLLFQVPYSNSASIKQNMEPTVHHISNPLKIKLTVGSKIFTVTLLENKTSIAFRKKLPLEINLIELNANEKYAQLNESLPVNESIPKKIQVGDLKLFGDHTIVLFYKTFSTSYAYTDIGFIEDVKELQDALGGGNIMVRFELLNN
jgi:hypothetical protein